MSKKHRKPAPPTSPAPPAKGAGSTRRVLSGLLGLYLLLGLAVAVIVPWDPAVNQHIVPPDETAHWEFIKDLASGKGLPVFTSGGGNYEAHQPPLYYLSAVWTAWLGGANGIYLARLWSLLISALTLAVAWAATRYLLGPALWPRLAAVGALAFVPGRLFIMASVSNDSLFELFAATTLLIVLRMVTLGANRRRAVLLGFSLGGALLTKTSALVLIAVVAVALVLEPSWRTHGLRRLLAQGSLVAGLALAIWGWWVVRNILLYGEPLAIQTFERIFSKDRATPELFLSRGLSWGGYWQLVARQTWLSLWGVFGQATVYMPELFYKLGSLIAGMGSVGIILQTVRARGTWGVDRARSVCLALAVLLVLLVLASFLRFNTVFYQAQARYLLAASVVLATALGEGVTGLWRGREACFAVALVLLLAAMSVWALAAHITGGYSLTPPGLG